MTGLSGLGIGQGYNSYRANEEFGASAAYSVGKAMATSGVSGNNASSEVELKALKRTGQVECATCASRKYKDGSDEANVSFKSAAHISPASSGARVMAHEQEHVDNAYKKAESKGGQVVNASVSLKTAICPECGRSYVSGGMTTTAIKYPKSLYGQNQKSAQYDALAGQNINYSV